MSDVTKKKPKILKASAVTAESHGTHILYTKAGHIFDVSESKEQVQKTP